MKERVETLRAADKIKLLADARRLDILRLLMASPATLTDLARAMGQSPAWVRHHVLTLLSAGLIEIVEVRTTGRVTEKFYRARSAAFLLQKMILPKGGLPAVVFSGSHDLALEAAGTQLEKYLRMLALTVGSLDGLVNLRQGLCQVCGSHLLDESGEYNTPFVRRLFPDREMEIVTLAYRTQGLMLAPSNPQGIKKIEDVAHKRIRFVNRNSGSGTRLWFDRELHRRGIAPAAVRGYESTVKTHSEAARLIEHGKADAALGLQAAAHQHGLDFIPLFEERYDLVLPRDEERVLGPLLDYVQSVHFRRAADSLTGYATAHSGEQIPL